MSHQPDDEDEEAPSLRPGHVELVEEEHTEHGAGWLYLPALDERTGWTSHRVPRLVERSERRRLGFGRR